MVARRAQDAVLQPALAGGGRLGHERGRLRQAQPLEIGERLRHVVAERPQDRLQQQPRRQQRDLRHERRRKRPADPLVEPVDPRSTPGLVARRRTILFATDRDGNRELYAMDADGRNPRNLTRHPGNEGVGWRLRLVAGRPQDRVRQHPRHARRRELRALRHERGRQRPAAADPHARQSEFVFVLVAGRAAARVRAVPGAAALGVLRHERRRERRAQGRPGRFRGARS